MSRIKPVYLETLESGGFEKKISAARDLLKDCQLCPRVCRVNRREGELGKCHIGYRPVVSSYFPHFGEEAPLVGHNGSGTIFMAGCNLQCLFCQNYEISHLLEGREISIERFSEMMLELQEMGCHNINIVTPSHIAAQLIEAVYLAAKNGLHLPLVYNTSGYDSMVTLKLLEGIVDIYMPDFKFFDDELAGRYTAVKNYATVAKSAIKEMHRQVGDLLLQDGIAVRGLLIRHLVMPGQLEDSRKIFNFIATEISRDTYINIMPQYRPAGQAQLRPEIARRLHHTEFLMALRAAQEAGLYRLDS
ncbi:MAG: radical SAM protein [Calditrichia bacterium]